MALLGKLLGDGLEGAGGNIVKKALKEASEERGEGILSKLGKKISSNVDDVVGKNADDMVTLYRGLTQKYDPKFPVSRLDTSGYESFTDNLDLAKQYGDNVVSINVPKRDIKTSYLDENPMSPTYGDRNPIYSIDKPAGLNGVSGKEYLLEVGSDYQKALKYNELANDLDNASKFLQPKELEQYLPKKLTISGGDVAQDIPVYGKNDLITDDSIFDDPAFADILKNNNKESVKAKATLNDLAMMKRAKAGEVLSAEEIANSRFARNLGIDAKKAQLKYGNKLNITKDMEEGKEKVPEELNNRLRGMADQVLDRLHKDPNVKYDHKAVIFMGGPSSGKSSAGMKLYDAAKGGDYAVIDSDDIKPMFEEFGKGEGAGAVHLASAYTAKKMVLPDAAAEGMNLALPIVGKSDNALNYHINLLKDAGYDVSVVDVSLPTDKAASRNFGRMMETNRNVEDDYVRNTVDQKPAAVYRKMVDNIKAGKDKRVSGYAKISNDVKYGEPQILEEISPSDVLKRVQDKFGKSVIVDKNGNLLDLYHGTDADFDKFGDIKTEPGYWFTEDKDYAQSHGKNLMTVNLDMRNPIDMTTADGDDLLYNLARERFGIKGAVPENKIFSKEFREFLQSKGYDGLIWDKDGKNTYVAFRPEQIKMRNKKLTK